MKVIILSVVLLMGCISTPKITFYNDNQNIVVEYKNSSGFQYVTNIPHDTLCTINVETGEITEK